MVRFNVDGEERVRSLIESILSSEKGWDVGIIIGKCTVQRHHVVHLVSSPKEEKPREAKSLDETSDQWICQHAKQAKRMLPGGLDIVGIFAAGKPAQIKDAQAKLKQILFAIHKMQAKSHPSHHLNQTTERILLHLCTETKKVICKSLDVAEPKSPFQPAEWKYSDCAGSWSSLHCALSVDVKVAVSQADFKSNVNHQINMALKPFTEALKTSIAAINGQLKGGNEPLQETSIQKKAKGGKKARGTPSAVPQSYRVDFFSPKPLSKKMKGKMTPEICLANISLRGVIYGLAYVTNTVSVDHAIQVLKEDLVDSLMSRCELMCDDISENQDKEQQPALDEVESMPRRVFVGLENGGGLKVCDYMFEDEQTTDCSDRLQEILQISPEDSGIDASMENFPAASDLIKPQRKESKKATTFQQDTNSDTEKSQKPSQLLGYAASAVGAVLAAILSYHLILNQE